MRILFTFAGGSGHFEPLVPVARAAQRAGHTIAYSGEPAMAPTVEAAGFTIFPSGPNTSSTLRRPLLALDADREDRALRDGYARRTARRRATDILAVCAEWRPDLLVCDEIDFGAMVAGERLGLPYARGRHIDPAEFGPQPANVRLERYLPQSAVLPYCDLVVCHAGSGSVGGALAHGLPMVLIPMGADQPLNAARAETLGVGRMLDPMAATSESVREATSIVLANASYRQAAEHMREELAAMPGPEHAVTLLERLAVEKGPILVD